MRILAAAVVALALAACGREQAGTVPPPQPLTAEAMGHYCGMNVLEHPGPKGQIILASRIDPVWFASVRDTIAFTMLPEEPKDIQAIYVSDMSKTTSWEEPGADNWVDARKAWFVIGSEAHGGMGSEEAVPFSARPAAEDFARRRGGRVVAFSEIPRDYVLGAGAAAEPGETPPKS